MQTAIQTSERWVPLTRPPLYQADFGLRISAPGKMMSSPCVPHRLSIRSRGGGVPNYAVFVSRFKWYNPCRNILVERGRRTKVLNRQRQVLENHGTIFWVDWP